MQFNKRFKQAFGTTLLCAFGTMAHAQATATDALILKAVPTVAPALPSLVANQDGTIKDQYIVTLRKLPANSLVKGLKVDDLVKLVLSGVGGGKILHTYDTALFGFAAQFTPAQAKLLKSQPLVLEVEQDRLGTISDTQSNLHPYFYNLDRIDQRDLPLNGSYSYPGKAGEGVHLYVIDSGINPNNPEFTGHIGGGLSFIAGSAANDWADCNGHGTHVAGTAAGKTFGVAKKATLHSLRVARCDGSLSGSDVLAALNWVAKNAPKPGVVNMSLGSTNGRVPAWEEAARAVVFAGYPTAVAAGNQNISACDRSPGADPYVLTVGAVDKYDMRASFSNYGSCVKIFAPGVDIVSAYYKDSTKLAQMSGTSMASPHVAGALAIKLSLNTNPKATAVDIERAVMLDGSAKVVDAAGSRNSLLYISQ